MYIYICIHLYVYHLRPVLTKQYPFSASSRRYSPVAAPNGYMHIFIFVCIHIYTCVHIYIYITCGQCSRSIAR